MKSIEGNFDNSEVLELLNKHFIELRSVSPEGSTHVLDIEGLKDQNIKFWSLWEDSQLMGCGALKFFYFLNLVQYLMLLLDLYDKPIYL